MNRGKSDRAKITETQLREQTRDLCKNLGWKFHFTWSSIHSPKGWPDLVLCRPPRLIFVELKTDKGILSPEQGEWLEALAGCDCEVYVWRPDDIDEITRILQRL